jgi:hypothetical protein
VHQPWTFPGVMALPLYAVSSRSFHRSVMSLRSTLRVPAQPAYPQSSKLVAEHEGVQVLAFVAKPEQLPER